MSAWEVCAIILAAMAAGAINTVVGSGTLITFPTLLFFGYPPVSANISNSLGLVAGGISGAWGYRAELTGLGKLVRRLVPMSLIGAIVGALLLLWLPPEAFETIVPILIALSLILVVLGPRLNRWTLRHDEGTLTGGRWFALLFGVFVAGAYGGYFGAAQGVLLVGLMGVLVPVRLQSVNAIKNVLSLVVNFVASLVFVIVEPSQINWVIVLLISAGSLLGGLVGAHVGRRLAPWLLRSVIVVVGATAIGVLLV